MNKVFTGNLTRARIRSILRAEKFGDRTRCPNCSYERKLWSLGDGRWQCPRCSKKFGLLTDTVLSSTRFSLPEIYELLCWFELELTDRKIAQRLEVNYNRIHRFYLNLRKAILTYEERSIKLLEQRVEVDETYFGADFKNRKRKQREKLRKQGKVKRGRGANELKQAVFGIYERADGVVYVKPVRDVTKPTLQDIIKGKVSIETTIYSDTWGSYNGLRKDFADHRTVAHKDNEYKRGDASINGIEGFWGYAKERLLKHHGMSADNFLLYLKEIEFRFNHRHLKSEQFINQLLGVILG